MKREVVEQNINSWHNEKTPVPEKKSPDRKTFDNNFRSPQAFRPKYNKNPSGPSSGPKPPPLDLGPADDDFVPLKELKTASPTINQVNQPTAKVEPVIKKSVNEKSLSDLRAVLNKINKDKPAQTLNQSMTDNKDKPKEIPEETLKKILSTDN